MFDFLMSLIGIGGKKPTRAECRAARRTSLTLQSLEARENRAGITVSMDAGILFITGSAGNDAAYVSIDTHGDNNPANDTLKCKLTHDGISETQTFALYKQTPGGLVKQIKTIDFDGLGGSDKLADFTDLALVAHTGPEGSAKSVSFWPETGGKLTVHGTSFNDTVTVKNELGGVHVAMQNKDGTLDVFKPPFYMTPQGVKPLINKIVFHGLEGNDRFTNDTYLDCDAYGGAGSDWLFGGSGNDMLDGDKIAEGYSYPSVGDVDFLFGRLGNDLIRGDQGDDWVYGGEGNDKIYGGEGNDYLDGYSGNDYIVGNEGNDSIIGSVGDDELHGDGGNDKVYGQSGNDNIDGGEGNDFLDGGADMDYLGDGGGTNELHGGDGADQIFVGHAVFVGVNTDVNFVYGEGGGDMIGSLGGTAYIHGGDGHDMLLGAGSGVGNKDFLYGEGGDDELMGGVGAGVLEGGNGDDWIMGGDANDTVSGGAGNDLLFGGLGSDTIDGGAGNDILIGGSCSNGKAADKTHDVLTGGLGNDRIQKDDNGMGGDFDTTTDFAVGDLKLASIAWGAWETDVNFRGKGKPVT